MLEKGQVVNEKREKSARPEINSDSVLALVQGQHGTFKRDVCFKIAEDSYIVKGVPLYSNINLTCLGGVGWVNPYS